MREEFLKFVKTLMEASPELTEELMTDNIKSYIAILSEQKEKPVITDGGKLVLKYLQSIPTAPYKAKEIAEGMYIPSRSVSGTLRKLTSDGFVEKIGKDPVEYVITEKGKNYIIEE